MQSTVATAGEHRIAHLVELAMKGLEPMYDSEKRLFCHRLVKTPTGMVREGISQRYTIMTLLGFLRAESAGLRSFVDIEAGVDRLLKDTAWVDNIGDLGLMFWLSAATSSKHLVRCKSTFDLSTALKRFPDAQKALTMELSWFLTGASLANEVEPSKQFEAIANETYNMICANQGPYGLFGHMGTRQSLSGRFRGRVGSFADQVYPTIAMAHFSRIFGHKEAQQNALRCGRAICDRQGPLGQWWWHYDAGSGRVAEHYPVYSVHQHAMGPMALLALQDTFGSDFSGFIQKGVNWIHGANELERDLEDKHAALVWRCIRPSKAAAYAARFRALTSNEPPQLPLHVLYECRPYELGWLLYAFAQSSS
jgi:hypothetical protein